MLAVVIVLEKKVPKSHYHNFIVKYVYIYSTHIQIIQPLFLIYIYISTSLSFPLPTSTTFLTFTSNLYKYPA